MMTPKQRRNIILGLSLALLLFFLLIIWFLLPKQKSGTEIPKEVPTTVPVTTSPYTTEQLQVEKETRMQASGVIAASKLFVERYGSYSNEANFQNVKDVLSLMSEKFRAATEKDLLAKVAPKGYFGVTTRVVTASVVMQDETKGTAVIDLSTQRVEENGSAQNTTTKYQDIQLTFVKESGVWKVDSATWR